MLKRTRLDTGSFAPRLAIQRVLPLLQPAAQRVNVAADISDDDLLRQLGRLDSARKLEFLDASKKTVEQFNAAINARRQRAATREDYEALEDVRSDAHKLYQSLERASRLGLPEEYLRDAWQQRADEPEGKDFPDFKLLLWQLAQSALWFMERKRPAHRPSEIGSVTAVVVRFLAHDYYRFFGRPATGSGSPFVKFLRVFLPANGLGCPSLRLLTKIVDKTLPAPPKVAKAGGVS